MLSAHTGLKFTAVIESGIVVDTTIAYSNIPATLPKCRSRRDLQLSCILAFAAGLSPKGLGYLLMAGSASAQKSSFADSVAEKEVQR